MQNLDFAKYDEAPEPGRRARGALLAGVFGAALAAAPPTFEKCADDIRQ